MKKMMIILALLAACMLCGCAAADDLGVQHVGGYTQSEPTVLVDVQTGQRYDIPGYARVLPVKFEYQDWFLQYDAGHAGDNGYTKLNTATVWRDISVRSGKLLREYDFDWCYHRYWYYDHITYAESGSNTDFGMLYIDLVNLHKDTHAFMKDAKVTVVFDGTYRYNGWVRQYNDDYAASTWDDGKYVWTQYPAIQPADEEPIDMMGTGRYIFGCTLPPAVAEGDEPLRMEITLGEHEIIYHIRK